MPFHDQHSVLGIETIEKIAATYGFDNPGPILAYPPNNFGPFPIPPQAIQSRLSSGSSVLVPYHPRLLTKMIATSRYLAGEVARSATVLINEGAKNKKDIDEFLFLIDAANFLASAGVGIGALVAKGASGTAMTSKEAILWLVESRAGIANSVTTMVVPSPEAPRKNFKFWVRHALGPWNPSFWASVYVACEEGDEDIYLYGTDAVAYKERLRIKQQADADIARLQGRIAEAEKQLAQPFYRVRR